MELTRIECSRIWRRRNKLRQVDIGDGCRRWERGEDAVPYEWSQDPSPLSEGELAHTLRQRAGDTLRQAAQRFGRSHMYITDIEQDRRRDPGYLEMYASEMDMYIPPEEAAVPFSHAPMAFGYE